MSSTRRFICLCLCLRLPPPQLFADCAAAWAAASVRARSRDLRAWPNQPQVQRAVQNEPRSTVLVS
ncbi:hypothetical protein ACFU76_21990 [Streptomyces sp. NPDC057539]|uniref:hypothetical protein n=1 Tax=Streptomyces sp. NPDC057539 TaxID=3346159 RepID=UPI0036972ABC